jgi:NAD(P)-dependent dehydrogenase (short-subunit alcohol dehydrogenase family)
MKSKNIIITGTSRGIGLELVRLLVAQGHQILALSRNEAPVKAMNKSNITTISFDLSDASQYKEVSSFISEHWNRVDVLINNAGALINKPFSSTTMDDMESVFRINVYGLAEMIRTVLPFMGKGGHVVNISSMGGVQGSMKFPGLAAYSSSKGAVITLTELLAEENKETGPSFNALALGAVQTEMLEQAFPGFKAPTTAAEMAQYIMEFALTGQKYYNGKLLQVSNSTP